MKGSMVVQEWLADITMMQQSVLLAGIRGPDGLKKDHITKLLLRWYRRCFLKSSFFGRAILDPWEDDGGSFLGPSVVIPLEARLGPNKIFREENQSTMTDLVGGYLKTVDEVPHHFQLHLMHGAEILGYKHPIPFIRDWWLQTYLRIVNDAHLNPETEDRMDFRLADREDNWRACEAGITADRPV